MWYFSIASYICLAIFAFVENCYNSPSRLFIIGGKELKSNEGTMKLEYLRMCWDFSTIIGPKFGYCPEPTKTWLMVKPYVLLRTNKVFSGTNTKISNEGHKYLWVTVGTEQFKDIYMKEKVIEWINQLEVLSKMAVSNKQCNNFWITSSVLCVWW